MFRGGSARRESCSALSSSPEMAAVPALVLAPIPCLPIDVSRIALWARDAALRLLCCLRADVFVVDLLERVAQPHVARSQVLRMVFGSSQTRDHVIIMQRCIVSRR